MTNVFLNNRTKEKKLEQANKRCQQISGSWKAGGEVTNVLADKEKTDT